MDGLLLVGFLQSSFAGFIILTKQDRQRQEHILGLWLILIAAELGLKILDSFFPEVRLFKFDTILLPMLQGPFILLYTRFLTSENPDFRTRDLLHMLPLVYGTILFFVFRNASSFLKGPVSEMSASSKSILISYVLNIILINLLYVVLALRLVNRYKQLMVNRFSVYDSRNNMVWLRFVQVFSLLVPLLFVLSSFLYLEVIHLHVNPGFSLNLGLTLLSFVVGYFGYNQSSVFPHKSSTLEGRQPAVGKAYTKSGMGSEGEVALMDRISQFVVRDKAFLDPELTIYRIGEVLEVPHYHVTQAINRVEGKNFYTYINALRVAEVKRKMQAGEAKQYTLLALALDCGFASKTTFNTVFKKLEGVTPTQYKKEISNLSGQK